MDEYSGGKPKLKKKKATSAAKKTKKPRGKSPATGVGKYTGPLLKAVHEKAKKEGRKPTKAELSKAFKDGWAEFHKHNPNVKKK